MDPNVAYAAALGKLGTEVAIVSGMSPLGRTILSAGLTVVNALGPAYGATLANQILEEVGTTFGAQIEAEVSSVVANVASAISAVADCMPLITMAVGAIMGAVQADASEKAMFDAAMCSLVMGKPVLGSLPGNKVAPSDIFEPDPTERWSYGINSIGMNMLPFSTLGIAFAAITEGQSETNNKDVAVWNAEYAADPINNSQVHQSLMDEPFFQELGLPVDDAAFDSPIYHSDPALHQPLPGSYVAAGFPGNWGIPREVRDVLRLLRIAMGTQNVDKGVSLMPIYLDILWSEWQKGHMDAGYANWLLCHALGCQNLDSCNVDIVDDNDSYGFFTDSSEGQIVYQPYCGCEAWAPYCAMIQKIVVAWGQTTKSASDGQLPPGVIKVPTSQMKFNLGSPAAMATLVLSNFAKDPSKATPAAIAYWKKQLQQATQGASLPEAINSTASAKQILQFAIANPFAFDGRLTTAAQFAIGFSAYVSSLLKKHVSGHRLLAN